MTDPEIRFKCIELAVQYSRQQPVKDTFVIAQQIYDWVMKNDTAIMRDLDNKIQEINDAMEEASKKLRSFNED